MLEGGDVSVTELRDGETGAASSQPPPHLTDSPPSPRYPPSSLGSRNPLREPPAAGPGAEPQPRSRKRGGAGPGRGVRSAARQRGQRDGDGGDARWPRARVGSREASPEPRGQELPGCTEGCVRPQLRGGLGAGLPRCSPG